MDDRLMNFVPHFLCISAGSTKMGFFDDVVQEALGFLRLQFQLDVENVQNQFE